MDVMSGLAGNASGWPGGTAQAQYPVTDLSNHVSGGQSATSAAANVNASDESRQVLWLCASLVLGAIALLWIFGALVFRGISL